MFSPFPHDILCRRLVYSCLSSFFQLRFPPLFSDDTRFSALFPILFNSLCRCCIHSEIPFEDQRKAFEPALHNKIKIIIANNSAVSSVTFPDVDNVIDLGASSRHLCVSLFLPLSLISFFLSFLHFVPLFFSHIYCYFPL